MLRAVLPWGNCRDWGASVQGLGPTSGTPCTLVAGDMPREAPVNSAGSGPLFAVNSAAECSHQKASLAWHPHSGLTALLVPLQAPGACRPVLLIGCCLWPWDPEDWT